MSKIHVQKIPGYDHLEAPESSCPLLMMLYDSRPVTISQAHNSAIPGPKIDCPVWQVKLKSVKPHSPMVVPNKSQQLSPSENP